jgi:hypothetical protein
MQTGGCHAWRACHQNRVQPDESIRYTLVEDATETTITKIDIGFELEKVRCQAVCFRLLDRSN